VGSRTGSPSSAPHARRKRTRCTGPACRKLAPAGRKRCDDHKPGASGNPATRRKLYGCTEPRLWTKPLRPLNRQTTRGYEVIDFAEMIGEPLLPWEQWVVIHALERLRDGHYRFRTILVLAARQNGKSHLKRIVSLWRMYNDGAKRILGVAQDVALARDQWNMCQDTIHDCPDLEEEWGRVRNVNGDEWFSAAGCRYAIKAANRRAGRGGSNDEVNIDELREQQDWKAWAAVSKTTMARPDGQVWAMSNAGDDESVVLNQLQEAALAGTDETLAIFEYSAPPGCELDDPAAIAQANPGLGHIITMRAILSALSEPPAVYRTEVLCQRVDALEGAVDAAAWKACGDPLGTMDGLRDRLATVFDVAPDGKHCTLAVAARRTDGKVRTEVARTWASTEEARAELGELLAKIKPVAFGWFPSGPAAALAPLLRDLAKKYNRRGGQRVPGQLPEDGELSGQTVGEACQGLADLVKGHQIVHGAQPLLDAHINGSRKLVTGDGWRFTRRGGGHCDGAYACAGAVNIALTMPAPKVAKIRVLVA
jgi:hypothetical protein